MKKIAVLGAGSWGTALSMVLEENGHDVHLYSNDAQQVKEINEQHTNGQFLKEVQLSPRIHASDQLQEVVQDATVILFVLPTKAIRPVAKEVAQYMTGHPIIVHASKGLEQGTHLRISEILAAELVDTSYQDIVVLSGPSHAEEVAVRDITTISAASETLEVAETVQHLFNNDYFRVYTLTDVVGVEIGAATKNIIAVAAGILAGLKYGDNAKAALMTRGLAEMNRFGQSFGANPMTFIGLTGVGDLIVTCTSVHSRNWRAGYQLGQGRPLDAVLNDMGMVVEGVATTKAVYELAQEKGIELPITNALYGVLYEGQSIKPSIDQLMNRLPKAEMQEQLNR